MAQVTADLPWDQPELPVIDRPDRFTKLDLAGPHKLVACGFKTERDAQIHIDRHDLAPQAPTGDPLGDPTPVLLVEHRVGRGYCVLEFPRWDLDLVPF